VLDGGNAVGETNTMIARSWTARASRVGAQAYVEFFKTTLIPELSSIEGHRGALVLEHAAGDDDMRITVVTFWESMTAVARFAGATPEVAVVEPDARALLRSFDPLVTHHEVVAARFDAELGAFAGAPSR
jgi:heme-degrading monooxygenase HmoA